MTTYKYNRNILCISKRSYLEYIITLPRPHPQSQNNLGTFLEAIIKKKKAHMKEQPHRKSAETLLV